MIISPDPKSAFLPVFPSITIISTFLATLNGLTFSFLTAFLINDLKIGKAVFEPVSYFPKVFGSSKPTYTPITKFEV